MALLPLSEFVLTPATHVVSLGGQCETAYNLRRFYGFSTAFPFDWWITPVTAVIELLRDFDLERLYDAARLEVTPDFGTVRHPEYNLQLHHEFPRDYENSYGKGARCIIPNFREYFHRPKERTAYLRNRFLGLNRPDRRVLFVRQQVPGLGGIEGERQRELLDELQHAFSEPAMTLVLVNTRGAREDFGVRSITIAQGAPTWHGYADAWDEALKKLDVTLDAAALTPFDRNKANPELHATD